VRRRARRLLRLLADRLHVPRGVEAQTPLAAALLDHLNRGQAVDIRVVRGEGFSYTISSEDFFALDGPHRALDERALGEARGAVLDVGAGAGRHALALQASGVDVVAIDVSPICVDVMRRRGVERAHVADVFSLDTGLQEGERYDTILFLMQSIGIAGSRFGLERLLRTLADRLHPGGQVLVDSSELRDSPDGEAGEVEVRFEYLNLRGTPFSWLYLSETDLVQIAGSVGWCCEILERADDDGGYLARLVPPRGEASAD
jgi:SAM-dependent methyltransferase